MRGDGTHGHSRSLVGRNAASVGMTTPRIRDDGPKCKDGYEGGGFDGFVEAAGSLQYEYFSEN